jgi:hypothetical protein
VRKWLVVAQFIARVLHRECSSVIETREALCDLRKLLLQSHRNELRHYERCKGKRKVTPHPGLASLARPSPSTGEWVSTCAGLGYNDSIVCFCWYWAKVDGWKRDNV